MKDKQAERNITLRAQVNAIRDEISSTRGWLEFAKRQMYDGKTILAEKAIIKAEQIMGMMEVGIDDVERMSK